MAHNFVEKIIDNITADQAQVSASFQIPKWAMFVGVWLLDLDAADVGIQMCETTDGTFFPVLDPADGQDLIICAAAADPGIIDISDFVRCVPSTWYLQLTFNAAQNTGPYTHKIFFRG